MAEAEETRSEGETEARHDPVREAAELLDQVIAGAANQAKHNAPVSPQMVKQLQMIRAKLG